MANRDLTHTPAAFRQSLKALSRWDNEGGAVREEAQGQAPVPDLTNVEMVHLRIRVIALESLVIALLAEASDRQLHVAREIATYISPRQGFTRHPLTIQAAGHITDMVRRAVRFRTMGSS